jgi:hypothetical protein
MDQSTPSNDDENKSQAQKIFRKAAFQGFYQILTQAPGVWKGPEARFYRVEKQRMMEHVEPFYWGPIVTAFLLATFRVSGSRSFLRFKDRYLFGLGNNNTSKSRIQQHEEPNYHRSRRQTSRMEKEAEKQQPVDVVKEQPVTWPTDLAVSIVCGVSSILWLSKPTKLQQDFVTAPLLPGKSLIHQHVCPEMVAALEKTNTVFQSMRKKEDPFATFVKNCQARSNVIDMRRRRLAESENPDVIPYPGIKGISLRDND